ncbi:LysM peptidoglycan-binding domain-containing protein [Pseudomonas sp. GD03651]|jgi:pilus assembly protein FimV|uniref:Peptidoglycan-binding protein n=1 Tax=Pseudomonas putida TaxID=303 RepID=A0A1L7N9S2_PSEPU|nr:MULTISPECIES: FimV/HubP family polar landmark protein [Pseudomonas]AGN81487.1 peptidoglycan-binding protein [Pseudomonas putida H8234]MCE0782653.1 LysM peptidoglycan-binding domain-containing protein [Pseudomonas sp. NMI542_15]MCE0969198.1 LysM peptidoglycan-binding domain-containing protein [Pseudomonas sp. NMI4491_12]MDH2185057.1 LysM peptidoglycan-binding domain-containing protein [Pseudomonas sp. GD03651]PMY79011.1 LysM peptidoglycan-binding domain-containing protein [Pseudomonas sp. FW
MLRIRKLVLAMAAASALSSGMANALGLGELTLKSAQNQPLDAEIELLDVRDLKAAEVAPSLAPPEEFSKAGVAFPTYLEDLTFTPVINPNGKSVLRVTSSQPLPGPVVKFLVQVMWPQGRLLRDYSVLLDQAKAQGDKPAAGNVTPATTGASNYTTQRRDTLWQIAARNTQGGSIQQTMIAIQALNPDAFIGNNINQLKVGQVLRLPDQQQVQNIAQGEANREVAEQYAAWREGRRLGPRARQLDATRRGAAEAAPARIAQGDNLRLVTPGSQAGAGQAKALNDKLAVAQESLDTSRRDNDELKSRMADLQSQLDKLQRLIELKNNQLARLEGQGAAAPAVAAAASAQPAAAAQPAVKPAPAAVDTAPKPVPAANPASASQSGSALDQILGNPWLLWLIAGSSILVLALLLWLLARKRKAQQEAEKHLRMARALEEEQGTGFDNDTESLDGVEVAEPSVTLSPAVVAASAAAAVAAEKVAAPAAEPALEPEPYADPHAALLAEVDQCLAEGRLNRATELLEPAVDAAPERDDLRLKLMDVYARQGDQSAFAEQERKLPASEHNTAQVAGLKERYPAMLGLAAAGLGAAALAAEMDQQYVQELLHDEPEAPVVADVVPGEVPEFEQQVEAEPEVVAQAEPEAELDAFEEVPTLDAPGLDEQDLDSAFDLSLGEDLPEEDPLAAPLLNEPAAQEPVPDELVIAEPVLDEPALEAIQPEEQPFAVDAELQADADADFEAMLAQAEPQPAADLSDFDLDVTEPVAPAAPQAVEEAPVDIAAELAAFDSVPEFDPVSEFDMPSDFDLSLSLEDDSPAAKRFASELDDVNAELDKLSQSLESPSLEPHFTSDDAIAQPEPEPLDDLDFDFFSGSDEVATKLDLARAYIDMGDNQGARDILDEVVKDGDDSQRQEAEDMLSRLV